MPRHHPDPAYYPNNGPSTVEGKHLAFLMGMDENRIPSEYSNSLDEMASAMVDSNADFAN